MPPKNRFVAAGSFGCVYAPSINCGQQRDDTVGKLFVKGRTAQHNHHDFEKELNANDLVREINTEGNFTITDKGECYISGNALTDDEKALCATTSKNREALSQTLRSLNADSIPQIIYEKSGVPLHDIRKSGVPLDRFLVNFRNIMEGLVRLNDTEYAHMDIKPANILYNAKKNRANLIDFGNFGREERLYADSQAHLLLLGHHYPFYPPEFRVLFMFSMGTTHVDIDPRILQKTALAYHYSLHEEVEMRACKYLDLPIKASKLNVLYTRNNNTKENADMIKRVEKGLRKLDPEIAKGYDTVLDRFHHRKRQGQIKHFLSKLKEDLFFDDFTYSHIKLAAMEKMFLNERFGAKIDLYSVGVSLMEVVYDYLMPVLWGEDVSDISHETHAVIISLLYIISGMVHPDPFIRLDARETLWLYSYLVNAIRRNSQASQDDLLERIQTYMRDGSSQ